MVDTSLIQDLIDEDLVSGDLEIVVERIYNESFTRPSTPARYLRTPKLAVGTVTDVYSLIKQVVGHYELRANTPTDDKIIFTEEDPDVENRKETITVSCLQRMPGAFSQGAPFEGKVKNLTPMLREEVDDPEHPGSKVAIVAYWYDNLIRLTCWARTNKAANSRADWLENMMEEYRWFFKAEGVDRVIFQGRGKDIVKDVGDNKWYGRPLDYFVRTEKISMISQEEIRRIVIKLTMSAV